MQSPRPGIPWIASRQATGEGRLSVGQNNIAVVLKVGAKTSSSSTWNLLGMQILGPSPGPLHQICHCCWSLRTLLEMSLEICSMAMLAHGCRDACGPYAQARPPGL